MCRRRRLRLEASFGERVVLADVFDRDVVLAAFTERRRILRESDRVDRRAIHSAFGRRAGVTARYESRERSLPDFSLQTSARSTTRQYPWQLNPQRWPRWNAACCS